jgi:integrase
MKQGETIWDATLPGFGVRCRTGQPTYVLKLPTGRRGQSRWLTIGQHGSPWIDQKGQARKLNAVLARKEAFRLLGEKNRGNDPAVARARARGLPTLKEFSARYLEDHAVVHKKPRSVADDRANLKWILPALGKIRIDQLCVADVSSFHRSRRKTPTNANRCLALVSHMCSMAERWGLRPPGSNPCRGVKRYPEKGRKRFLSTAEIARLGIALDALEAEDPIAVQAIRLILFTGARKNEILSLKWTEVDFERGILALGDSKSGEKPIYLNAPSKAILASLPKLSGNSYVLPGRRTGRHLTEVRTSWEEARKRAGIEDVRLHDLRHSFASVLVSGGASLPLIGGLLGHSNPQTTHRYAHLSDDPLRAASERAGETIAEAMRQMTRPAPVSATEISTNARDEKARGKTS